MKKVLLAVALLLLATPVFAADVTITATTVGAPTAGPNQLQQVRIGYTGAADVNTIRAFALVLTVDNGTTLVNIRDFNRGESLTPGGGFGIFPGKVRDYINAASPNWADTNYNPLAPSGDPNGTGGNDNPRMVVELGTLYKDANAPGTSGTLFSVDVNSEGKSDCNLCIAVDQTRGGVVKNDATGAAVTLPGTLGCTKVTFAPPDCLYVGRVFSGTGITTLTITATHISRWVALGKPNCWCCDAQKRGNGVYVPTSTSLKVDALDLAKVKNSAVYNKVLGDAGYNTNACLDTNLSGKIDALDLAKIKNSTNWAQVVGPGSGCP